MEMIEAKSVGKCDGKPKGGDTISTLGFDVDAKRAQLIELLEVQLVGQSLATIKTKNELMRLNVDGVKLEKPGEVKSPGKAKLDAMGMMLCQSVKRMIDFGGYELTLMLEIDFDVVAFQCERQVKFNRLDSDHKLNAELLEDTLREPCSKKRDDEIVYLSLEKKSELKSIRASIVAERRSRRTRGESAESENEAELAAAQKQMEYTLQEYTEEVRFREMGKFRVAMLAYEKRLEEVKVAKRGQKQLVDEQLVEQLMLARLSGYIAVINSIVNKISGTNVT